MSNFPLNRAPSHDTKEFKIPSHGGMFINATEGGQLINPVSGIEARDYSEARELFFWAQRQYETAASERRIHSPPECWLGMSRVCAEACDALTAEGKKANKDIEEDKPVNVHWSLEQMVMKYLDMLARKREELRTKY